MSDNLTNREGSFVISTVEPGTVFKDNKAILSFYFSDALDANADGFPTIQSFIERATGHDYIDETTLTINVDYDKIPDDFLDGVELGNLNAPDDGCYHVGESARERIEKMIAGLEASLKKLKDVKFHPNF